MKTLFLSLSILFLTAPNFQDFNEQKYYSVLEYHFKENATTIASKNFIKADNSSFANGALYSLYETQDGRYISALRDAGSDVFYEEVFYTEMQFFGYNRTEVYQLIRALYTLERPISLNNGCTSTLILEDKNKGTFPCSENKSYTDFTNGAFSDNWNQQILKVSEETIELEQTFTGPSGTSFVIEQKMEDNMVFVQVIPFST